MTNHLDKTESRCFLKWCNEHLVSLDFSKSMHTIYKQLKVVLQADQVTFLLADYVKDLNLAEDKLRVNHLALPGQFGWTKLTRIELRPLFGSALKDSKNVWSHDNNFMLPVVHEELTIGYFVMSGVNISLDSVAEFSTTQGFKLLSRHLGFCKQHHEIGKSAYLDSLTGLYNQKFLEDILPIELGKAKDKNGSFTVLFIDIDYFKMVNDNRGHLIGSQVLHSLGQLILQNVRHSDYAFRYGGDEFVVVLPEAAVAESQVMAERMRRVVEEYAFVVEGVNLGLTVSIGLATFPEHAQTTSQILEMADRAMYFGKNKSRNIVYIAS